MLKLGMCITGSFCSMDNMLSLLQQLQPLYDIEIFMTPHVDEMNTRFYSEKELKEKLYEIVPKKIHTTIQEAEVYGPLKKLDVVLLYPCDSNTLSKIDLGINDNVVTMVVKSSLRNHVPIVLGVFSNDVLSNSGVHLMSLLNKKDFYLVPMFQDHYQKKPNSMIASQEKVLETIEKALHHEQIQPFFLGYKEV